MTSPSSDVAGLWVATVFAPVPTLNPFEVTVERLVRGIRLGVLPVGAPLPPERELAERFGISRVTLREAIRALRDAGLVQSRRGRGGGTFVVADAPARRRPAAQIGRSMGDDLRDALTFRRLVEPGAAELAASRKLTRAERGALKSCLGAATGVDETRRRSADSRLHMAIAVLCGSPSVARAVADVQLRLDELLRAIPVITANIAHSDAQHAQLVGAVLAGDAAIARAVMADHVDGTAALLTGFLG